MEKKIPRVLIRVELGAAEGQNSTWGSNPELSPKGMVWALPDRLGRGALRSPWSKGRKGRTASLGAERWSLPATAPEVPKASPAQASFQTP